MKILIACVLVTGVSGLGSLVSAQTTLAEASEAAKKIHHEWPVSTNQVPVFDPANAVPVTDVLAASPVPEESAAIVPPVKQDEAWWKSHMGGLRDKVATDAAVCEPLAAKILALPIRCEVNPPHEAGQRLVPGPVRPAFVRQHCGSAV
jgi:hypothetical protein